MTERKKRRKRPVVEPTVQVKADEAERSLGRAVALGLPALCIVAALVVGAMAGLGSAILVLASGTLLGAIGLLWASLRTLSGDAPLPVDLERLATRQRGVDHLEEEKRRILRALKDLEAERDLGKIDHDDYEEIVARYRNDAKEVMRKMDLSVAPLRDDAERIAREYLQKKSLVPGTTAEPSAAPADRSTCASCGTSNEPDAAFCKKCGASMTPREEAETSHVSR